MRAARWLDRRCSALRCSLLARGAVRRRAALRPRRRVRWSLAAGAVAWVVARRARASSVAREVGARRVIEDEPLPVEHRVQRGRAAAARPGVDRRPAAAGARAAGGRAAASRARAHRRALRPPRAQAARRRRAVVVRDPFGLAARVVVGPRAGRRAARAPADRAGASRARRAATAPASPAPARARAAVAAEVELDGLRPLREGTPASRIYWPSLARGAGLMERRLRAEADTRPLVVLDPRGAAARGGRSTPRCAPPPRSRVHLARRRRLRAAAARRPAPGRSSSRPAAAGRTLHVRLALVEGARAPVARRAGRTAAGPCCYVAARARAPRRRGRSAARAGRRPMLVVPGELAGRRAVVRGRRLPRLRAVAAPARRRHEGGSSSGRGRRSRGSRATGAAARVPPRSRVRPRSALATFPRWRAFAGSALGDDLLAPRARGRAVAHGADRRVLGAALVALAAVAQPRRAPWSGARSPCCCALAFVLVACGHRQRACCVPTAGATSHRHHPRDRSLPRANVPYRGADDWVRIDPRRRPAAWCCSRPGSRSGRGAAPARPPAPLSRWASSTSCRPSSSTSRTRSSAARCSRCCWSAFLWGERLERDAGLDRRHAGRRGADAPACSLGAALDGGPAAVGLRDLADPLAGARRPSSPGTTATAPLNWPRDGRELLRVKAQTAAYWKAVNLDEFDGVALARGLGDRSAQRATRSSRPASRNGTRRSRVVVRDLRSVEYIAAGTASEVTGTRKLHVRDPPGTFVTGRTPLRRGDAYTAQVYTPRPSEAQLQPRRHPTTPTTSPRRPRRCRCPRPSAAPVRNPFNDHVDAAATRWRSRSRPAASTCRPLPGRDRPGDRTRLAARPRSAYAREYALAQRLAARVAHAL